jgi:hypothetical protein
MEGKTEVAWPGHHMDGCRGWRGRRITFSAEGSVVAGLTLYMNVKTLPDGLKPSRTTIIVNVIACICFIGFAALYLGQLISSLGKF